MDIWHKARSFAEEAAKRSQEFTIGSSSKFSDIVTETTKRTKQLTVGSSSKLSEIVSETAKRSKELAAEASKRADLIKIEAIKRADQIKSLAEGIAPSAAAAPTEETALDSQLKEKLERYGVTDELREFVAEITPSTFQDFPLEDDTKLCDVDTVSNVRQDLTDWQAKHASLVLSTVKKISQLRYELCPRVMKERKFWRIYFILVNNHVAPYEKRYIEETMQKPAEQEKDDKIDEPLKVEITSKPKATKSNQQNKASTLSSTEQDLDFFLLGEDSDEGPDDGDEVFDDDLDKMVDSSPCGDGPVSEMTRDISAIPMSQSATSSPRVSPGRVGY